MVVLIVETCSDNMDVEDTGMTRLVKYEKNLLWISVVMDTGEGDQSEVLLRTLDSKVL